MSGGIFSDPSIASTTMRVSCLPHAARSLLQGRMVMMARGVELHFSVSGRTFSALLKCMCGECANWLALGFAASADPDGSGQRLQRVALHL